jgi:hypothetical protein
VSGFFNHEAHEGHEGKKKFNDKERKGRKCRGAACCAPTTEGGSGKQFAQAATTFRDSENQREMEFQTYVIFVFSVVKISFLQN